MDQGLLGMTISPDMRWLYLNRTDSAGSSVVTAHEITSTPGEIGSGIEIIVVDQPSAMHNGGDLVFGPSGDLFVVRGWGRFRRPIWSWAGPFDSTRAVLRQPVDPTSGLHMNLLQITRTWEQFRSQNLGKRRNPFRFPSINNWGFMAYRSGAAMR